MARVIEIARERQLAAAPERVWGLVSSVDRLPEWLTLAEQAEHLGGDGAGRRQRIHGHWGHRVYEIDQVVTVYEPPREVAWRHESERFGGKAAPRIARETTFRIRLHGTDGGTLVSLESRQEPMGALRGLVLRLAGAQEIAGHLERSLDRLEVATRL